MCCWKRSNTRRVAASKAAAQGERGTGAKPCPFLCAGHLPYWRYDKFLDYAAELVMLRKVGGGYRFAHDYLRQYMARAARE